MTRKKDTKTGLERAAQVITRSGPVIGPAMKRHTGHRVSRLLGFWMVWHTYGNNKDVLASGIYSPATLYRQRGEFLETFGVTVEDFDPELAAVFAARRQARTDLARDKVTS